MCSRQCFHWNTSFRIVGFRFSNRKCGDDSRRGDQSKARLFPSMSAVFEVNGFEGSPSVDITQDSPLLDTFLCPESVHNRSFLSIWSSSICPLKTFEWRRCTEAMGWCRCSVPRRERSSKERKVSNGKSACSLLSSSERCDCWRCVGILSVTKKKRGSHSSEWCFAFPLKSSNFFFAHLWSDEILLSFSNISEKVDSALLNSPNSAINFESIRKSSFDGVCRHIRPHRVTSMIVSKKIDSPNHSGVCFDRCFLSLNSRAFTGNEIDRTSIIFCHSNWLGKRTVSSSKVHRHWNDCWANLLPVCYSNWNRWWSRQFPLVSCIIWRSRAALPRNSRWSVSIATRSMPSLISIRDFRH